MNLLISSQVENNMLSFSYFFITGDLSCNYSFVAVISMCIPFSSLMSTTRAMKVKVNENGEKILFRLHSFRIHKWNETRNVLSSKKWEREKVVV